MLDNQVGVFHRQFSSVFFTLIMIWLHAELYFDNVLADDAAASDQPSLAHSCSNADGHDDTLAISVCGNCSGFEPTLVSADPHNINISSMRDESKGNQDELRESDQGTQEVECTQFKRCRSLTHLHDVVLSHVL